MQKVYLAYLNSGILAEQNKGSLDGVVTEIENESHIPALLRYFYSQIWSSDPSNYSKFDAEYEYER